MALTAHRDFTGVFSMTQASLSRPGGQVLPGAFVLRARRLERVFFFKKHRRPSWSDRSSEGTAESGIGRTSTIPLQYLTVPFLPLSQSFEASFCLVLDADPSFPFNIWRRRDLVSSFLPCLMSDGHHGVIPSLVDCAVTSILSVADSWAFQY
jgi:hypothetical protein